MKKTHFLLVCCIQLMSSMIYASDAPVTIAGYFSNAIPGAQSVPIPVSVNGFNEIGGFTLTLAFDTTKVRFVSASSNPSLPGMTITYFNPDGNKQGKIIFSWLGVESSNISLADGSTIANLTFTYISGPGILSWEYLFGSVCVYKRYVNGVLTALNDNPKNLFYQNGNISNVNAPVTFAPVITLSTPGPFQIPVTVNNFKNIGALTLYLEYDPTIITYQNSFTGNVAFGSSFMVGNIAGNGGKMQIVIQWFGSGGVNLPDGSVLCTLDFTYSISSTASCNLNWYDIGPSCEYADGSGNILNDIPAADYYKNGNVTLPLVPDFIADNLTPPKNTTVRFNDLTTGVATSWNWNFNRTTLVFVNGTNASSQNPQVQFTDGGLYTVTLVVQNAYSVNTVIKSDYIRAGVSGLWSGTTSSDWFTQSNWDNYLLPVSNTGVIIPPYALHWPVFDGDLTIGIHCGTLTLSGSTSMMTIMGVLTIP